MCLVNNEASIAQFIVSVRQIYNFLVWFRRAKRGLRVQLFSPCVCVCVCVCVLVV